ncbi:MAG: SMC-Scp complex subunit ScpB [Candidatus Nanoarchaeia archaeon]|nr:SMC-Scp complex subunit ScpB [Candidatus Nanoarchaeia archaeon]
MKKMKDMIEALLFAKTRGMTAEEIRKILKKKKEAVENNLKDLKGEYERRNSGIIIVSEGEKWRMRIRNDLVDYAVDLVPMEMKKSVLETLSVIAWRGPIKQSTVIKIRGNKAYEHIKMLLEEGFVEQEPFGKTYKLKVTPVFEDYFSKKKKEIKKDLKETAENAETESEKEKKAHPVEKQEAEKSIYETNS